MNLLLLVGIVVAAMVVYLVVGAGVVLTWRRGGFFPYQHQYGYCVARTVHAVLLWVFWPIAVVAIIGFACLVIVVALAKAVVSVSMAIAPKKNIPQFFWAVVGPPAKRSYQQ